MLWRAIRLALQAIRRNALRSFLTVLGIVIGVGAVIAMVTIGHGTTERVTSDLQKLGSNLLIVRPGQSAMRGPGAAGAEADPFKERDLQALRQQLYEVRAVAPVASRAVTAVFGNENWNTRVTGTDNAFLAVQDWNLVAGRRFLDSELRAGRAVCIIGATVRQELFGRRDPIGERIRLRKIPCEVIGLLEAKGETSFGTDQDDTVLLPLRAFHRRIAGDTDIATIMVSAADTADTAKVQADIERLLRERRHISPGEDDDFYVRDMKQVITMMAGTTSVMTGLLGAVAAVSLLVGGIGIMNIMLVSVTERTREIGIRLAVGALERQVLLQFLVEAVVLSLFGGTVGIVLGLGLAGAAVELLDIPFVFDPAIVVIAFVFSAAVGVIFGFVPARRAARLDPIEALRHE
ncbi:ABC transporter permease [Ferruginivarius sediminum]|uniref:ABC transporter permease n=1 Tax=Ferruginivarius sediminum TaxID=2661937 RepID=A0A369TAZ3_9PROT|nr:ABC transporter permease [Ferruginivarius sediminum]RDD62460.1 ABC transporter permease [Ferruginivarius sediminum]